MFDHDTLSQEKHDDVTDSTSTGRPVCGSESTKRCVLTPAHVEEDQTSTERPVLVDQKEEHEIDFRVPGLSHAVVKEAEHVRVQVLVNKSKIWRAWPCASPMSHRELCLVPIVRGLGLLLASWGSLGVKLRWFGPPLSTRVLLLFPCFCLWPLFRTCKAGSFF